MIQVDAAINSGNSGGGMFNTLGQLQGVPARKYSSNGFYSASIENIGMCIPINVAKPLIEEVLRGYNGDAAAQKAEKGQEGQPAVDSPLHGKPRLGITGANVTSAFSSKLPMGSVVKTVDPGSPAEEGGILVGDIIVEVNGEITSNMTALQNKLAAYKEGDAIQIKVFRDEGFAEQVAAGEQYINMDQIGEGEYIDLQVTLRVVDDLNM